MEKRPALGKGLSALIPDEPAASPHVAPVEVDIDRLVPNEFQPRLAADDPRLDELTQSVAAHGVIQPIVVRRVGGDRFQIIAGERRWRAAKRAGLGRVPVVVKEIAAGRERSLLEMALVENIQRENLNPIDEAAWVSTNATAQWGLAAIQCLALVGDSLPANPPAPRGRRGRG